MVQSRHLIHVEFLETLVQQVDTCCILFLVTRSLHDLISNFHVREGIKHGDFAAEKLVVVNQWWAVTAEFVGNG